MAEEKFKQLNVKEEVKQEIDLIAITERRFVYEVIEDMLKLYKHVVINKSKSPRNIKTKKSMSVSEFISSQ